MTDQAIATTETRTATEHQEDKRKLALLKAVGLDRLTPEQRELALHIADRYELDLLLKHVVMIEGRPYITRDGLLHIAHRSKQLDGIETTDAKIIEGFWRSTCSVYRKDMTRPFTYTGRYPTSGGNQKYAPEMAVKVGEVMALRRAFDVSAPVVEERWDVEAPAESESAAVPSLAERVAAQQASLPGPSEAAGPVVSEAAVAELGIEADDPRAVLPIGNEPLVPGGHRGQDGAHPMTLTEIQERAKGVGITTVQLNTKSRELFNGRTLQLLTTEERQKVAEEVGIA